MNAVHKCEGFKLVGFIADSLRLQINLALQSGYLYNQFRLDFFFPQLNALRQEGAYTLFTHRGFVLQKKAFYMCIAKWMTDFMGVVRKEKKKK